MIRSPNAALSWHRTRYLSERRRHFAELHHQFEPHDAAKGPWWQPYITRTTKYRTHSHSKPSCQKQKQFVLLLIQHKLKPLFFASVSDARFAILHNLWTIGCHYPRFVLHRLQVGDQIASLHIRFGNLDPSPRAVERASGPNQDKILVGRYRKDLLWSHVFGLSSAFLLITTDYSCNRIT